MQIYCQACAELRVNGGIFKDKYGTHYYKPDYIYHREDGPAKEWYDGNKDWWYNDTYIMKTRGDVTPEQVLEYKLRIL